MLSLLPWQQSQWQQFVLARQQNRLAHALLLTGPDGIGLNEFAEYLAASLFCFDPGEKYIPCGACKSCELFTAGNHPDIHKVVPEEEGKQIKVEQIRDLINFINLKSQYEHHKIAVINPADSMNRSAANTLLKTLEEPPGLALLVLLSNRPNLLPVTIRSRCQQIWFNPVYDQTSSNWLQEKLQDPNQAVELLKMSGGAPLLALELTENDTIGKQNIIIKDLESLQKAQDDPIQIADKWNKFGASQVLQWLLQLFSDMVKIKSNAEPGRLYQSDMLGRMQGLTNRLDLYRLMLCHDLILRNYGLSTGQVSYNSQGLLEDFIIYWQNQTNQRGG